MSIIQVFDQISSSMPVKLYVFVIELLGKVLEWIPSNFKSFQIPICRSQEQINDPFPVIISKRRILISIIDLELS